MPAPWEVWSRGSAPGGISSVEQSASQLATRVWLLVNNWSFIDQVQVSHQCKTLDQYIVIS